MLTICVKYFTFRKQPEIHNISDARPGGRCPYYWFFSLIGAGKFAENMRKGFLLQYGITGKLNRALLAGEKASVKFYEEHAEEVKASVPPEYLIVFSVKEGWQPLCSFLGLPVPSIPFFNIND